MFKIDSNNNMTIVKGDTAIFSVSLDGYEFQNGDKLFFSVKSDAKDLNYSIHKIIDKFDTNIAKIVLDNKDTDLTPGTYKYDIQVSLSDGRVDTIVTPKKFIVLEGITHD